MKGRRFFRTVIFLFMLFDIVQCILRLLYGNLALYDYFQLANCAFAVIIYCGLYSMFKDNITGKLFLAMAMIEVVTLTINCLDLALVRSNTVIMIESLIIFLAFVASYIMTMVVGFAFIKNKENKQLYLLGIIFIIQANIDLFMLIVGSVCAKYIYLYANRLLVVNGLFVVATVVEIYLLFCMWKLFRKPVSDDDIDYDDQKVEKEIEQDIFSD